MLDHTGITWEQTQDPPAKKTNSSVYMLYSRDPCRTPFQWDSSTSAGFSQTTNTWLPVHPNYMTLNLAAQLNQPGSHIEIYKKLTKLRATDTLMHGNFLIRVLDTHVFAYVRFLDKSDTYVVVINLGGNSVAVDLSEFESFISDNVKVEISQLGSKLTEG